MTPSFLAKENRNGYTLVEILVAMAIASIVILCLTELVAVSSNTLVRNNQIFESSASGRLSISLIEQDICGLIGTQTPTQAVYLEALPNTSTTNGSNSMFLILNTKSAFDSFSSSSDYTVSASDRGQTRAILYGIGYQNLINGTRANPAFGLFRSSVTAAATATSMLNSPDLFNSFQLLPVGAFDSGINPLSMGYTPSVNDLVSPSVVDLEVAIYCNQVTTTGTYGSPILINPWNSSTQTCEEVQLSRGLVKVQGVPIIGTTSSPGYTYGSVNSIVVSITVLDNTGVVLWGTGTGTGALAPAQLKAQHGYVLSRSVPINSF